jgi:hypothetical protein
MYDKHGSLQIGAATPLSATYTLPHYLLQYILVTVRIEVVMEVVMEVVIGCDNFERWFNSVGAMKE